MVATMRALKDALVVLETKEAWSTICDERYENSPENPEVEAAFDLAYREEMEAFNRVRDLVVALTGMEVAAAGTMLRMKRTEVESIVKRWRGR